jgi:hypothetical protein
MTWGTRTDANVPSFSTIQQNFTALGQYWEPPNDPVELNPENDDGLQQQ